MHYIIVIDMLQLYLILDPRQVILIGVLRKGTTEEAAKYELPEMRQTQAIADYKLFAHIMVDLK